MKKTLLLIIIYFYLIKAIGQIAINATGNNPHASAALDVDWSDKGLLIPRVALTQTTSSLPITSPAISLLVYNTATQNDVFPGYYFWDGAKWVRILSGTGNITCSTPNYILKSNGVNAVCSQIYDNGTNVGIGTTTPSDKLVVSGHIKIYDGNTDGARLIWTGGTGGTQEYRARVYTDGSLSFFPVEVGNPGYVGSVLRLTQGGFVGIGEVNPLTKLHIHDGAVLQTNSTGLQTVMLNNDGGIELYRHNTSSINPTCNGYIDFKNTTADDYRFRIYWNYSLAGGQGGLTFSAGTSGMPNSETPLMVILNNGNVGIGTTSPNYKLDVNGNVNASNYYTYSDIRFKKDIEPIQTSINEVLKLKPVKYNWKVKDFPDKNFDEKRHIGLIAQDVEKIFPELVNTDKEGYKHVDYANFVPILVKAIQELNERIENLEKQNKELENLSIELKAQIKQMQNAGIK